MRTYLILKEKARQLDEDREIQDLIAQIRADDGTLARYQGAYSRETASALKVETFDRLALGRRGQPYERLDQLVVELLLGVR
jgi:xylose isomerase